MKMCAVACEFLGKIINSVGDIAGAFVFRGPDLCLAHDLDRAGAAGTELFKGWIFVDGPSTASPCHAGSRFCSGNVLIAANAI